LERFPRTGLLALLAGALLATAPAPARAQGNLGVATRDGLDAWAVGDSGRFYRTLDGGATWCFGDLGVKTLRAVAARRFHVIITGDSGHVWHSADAGGTWTLATITGAPALRAIDMTDDSTGYIVGDVGTVVRITHSGATLTPLASGIVNRLDAVRFIDAQHGWVTGANGFAARTSNGGASWTPVPLGTARELRAVDVAGGTVWIVGDDAAAYRSADGGTVFSPLDLGLDTRADLRAVHLATVDTVWLAGGGGFLRRSTDAGASWTWPVHPFHGAVGGIAFARAGGFLCGTGSRAVLHSGDHGATWALPTGTLVTRTWTPKLTFGAGVAQVRGNTLAMNPVYKSELYAMLGFTAGGVKLYRSLDAGETWTQSGPTLSTPSRANALVISPRDSSSMLALVTDPGQILRTTDAGASWTPRLTHAYGEFGSPLTADPNHPDTLYFGGDTTGVWRSLDGGDHWSPWGATVFREPCDLKVVPDSDQVVLLTDGVSGAGFGEAWRSGDGGITWAKRYTGTGQTSELPELAVSRLRPGTAFATAWRTDGALRSTDRGATWSIVNTAMPAWGIAIAHDDPNVVVLGMYGGATSYLSLDGGTTWSSIPLSAANYSFFARDRGTLIAEQSNGLYKFGASYAFTPTNTQALALTAPAGGETWDPRQVRTITWSPVNIALARLEYRTAPAQPWQWIADVGGALGRFDWTVPVTPTGQAQVRVSDVWDGSPADSSAAAFTISTVLVGESRPGFFALQGARPNPFTGRTELSYTLGQAAHVRLELFDVQGERVAVLVDAWQTPGPHTVSAGDQVFRAGVGQEPRAAGIYFARLTAGGQVATRKLVRLR